MAMGMVGMSSSGPVADMAYRMEPDRRIKNNFPGTLRRQ